uniref:HAT C-terminal dimerisation domain-containing protein n=1 Tax=Amphiprion percula TaxID=161767 RepID=A0A3P8SRC8_AMPPE
MAKDCFSLQLDVSTDTSDTAQLYYSDGVCRYDCKSRAVHNTAQERMHTRSSKNFTEKIQLPVSPAMVGRSNGFIAKCREDDDFPDFLNYHCIIHQQALCAKIVNMKEIMDVAAKIKTDCNHFELLLHTSVRCLSRGGSVSSRTSLPNVASIKRSISSMDSRASLSMAYLSCILDKLNGLNMSLQGENTNVMSLNDKIRSFKRKVDRWIARVEIGKIDMFPELEEFMEENDLSVNTVKKSITSYLQALLEHFNKFFPEETAPEKNDWIQSPFTVTTTSHLSSDMEDALVELSSDLQKEYPPLSRAAMDVLTPFGCMYLCEKMFSALTYIKNKYRSRLNVEDDLRVAVSKIKPRIDLLCSTHSVHPSH